MKYSENWRDGILGAVGLCLIKFGKFRRQIRHWQTLYQSGQLGIGCEWESVVPVCKKKFAMQNPCLEVARNVVRYKSRVAVAWLVHGGEPSRVPCRRAEN